MCARNVARDPHRRRSDSQPRRMYAPPSFHACARSLGRTPHSCGECTASRRARVIADRHRGSERCDPMSSPRSVAIPPRNRLVEGAVHRRDAGEIVPSSRAAPSINPKRCTIGSRLAYARRARPRRANARNPAPVRDLRPVTESRGNAETRDGEFFERQRAERDVPCDSRGRV